MSGMSSSCSGYSERPSNGRLPNLRPRDGAIDLMEFGVRDFSRGGVFGVFFLKTIKSVRKEKA